MNEIVVRDEKQMGTALQRFRKSKSMTQKEAAEAAGIRQATVSDVERAEPETKTSTIYKMLAALDLEIVIRPRTKRDDRLEDLF